MTDKSLVTLPAAGAFDGSELFYLEQLGHSRRATIADLFALALTKSLNLSDVPNPTLARTNLGVDAAIAAAIAAIIGTAPGVLDTLGEISDAINDDANLYTTLVALINVRAPLVMGIDTVAGTTYTFASADSYRHKRFTNAGAIVATVPTNASDPIPVGTRIRGTQAAAGQVTLTPAGGVTLNSADGALKSRAQYSVFEIEKVGTNEWDVLGDVAA